MRRVAARPEKTDTAIIVQVLHEEYDVKKKKKKLKNETSVKHCVGLFDLCDFKRAHTSDAIRMLWPV